MIVSILAREAKNGPALLQDSRAIFSSIPSSSTRLLSPSSTPSRASCLAPMSFLARENGSTFFGQRKNMERRSLSERTRDAQFAALQAVEHRHEIRPQDAKRVGYLGLVAAGIPVEQQQHRELRRRQLQRRDAANEIIEDSELRALEGITEGIATIDPPESAHRPLCSATLVLAALLLRCQHLQFWKQPSCVSRGRSAVRFERSGVAVILDNRYEIYQIASAEFNR